MVTLQERLAAVKAEVVDLKGKIAALKEQKIAVLVGVGWSARRGVWCGVLRGGHRHGLSAVWDDPFHLPRLTARAARCTQRPCLCSAGPCIARYIRLCEWMLHPTVLGAPAFVVGVVQRDNCKSLGWEEMGRPSTHKYDFKARFILRGHRGKVYAMQWGSPSQMVRFANFAVLGVGVDVRAWVWGRGNACQGERRLLAPFPCPLCPPRHPVAPTPHTTHPPLHPPSATLAGMWSTDVAGECFPRRCPHGMERGNGREGQPCRPAGGVGDDLLGRLCGPGDRCMRRLGQRLFLVQATQWGRGRWWRRRGERGSGRGWRRHQPAFPSAAWA